MYKQNLYCDFIDNPKKAGDTVTYVICKSDDKDKATDRAFHPSEVAREKLEIDYDYYFKSQLIPVLSRLLDPIDGTDDKIMAERFGLDPAGFKSKAAMRQKAENEAENAAIAMQKEEDKLQFCDSLMVNVNEERVELDINFYPPFDNWRETMKPEIVNMIGAQLRNGSFDICAKVLKRLV